MTSRAHIETDPDTLEAISFAYRLPIERSADEERMYVVRGGTVYWAPSPDEAATS